MVAVSGRSMEPTFYDGEWLLVRWFSQSSFMKNSDSGFGQRRALKEGSIVVVERDKQPGVHYIKRVTQVNRPTCGAKAPSTYWVESDNPDGTGSHIWGWLNVHEIKARVLFKVAIKKASV